jgi:hypothetical protein
MRQRGIGAAGMALALVTLPGWTTTTALVPGSNDRAADLEFEYQFGLEEGERFVGIPRDLASGDRFVVRFRSSEPLYACLFVTNSAGSYTAMRADDGEAPCARVGRAWSVLPDSEAVLRLDEKKGVERLYLIVSRRPAAEFADMPDAVSEAWLISMRDRYGKSGRWTHELGPESMSVSYRAAGGAAVAVEQLTFNHR